MKKDQITHWLGNSESHAEKYKNDFYSVNWDAEIAQKDWQLISLQREIMQN